MPFDDAARRQRNAADARTARQRFQTRLEREQQAAHRRAQYTDDTGCLLANRREQAGKAAVLAGLSPAYRASVLTSADSAHHPVGYATALGATVVSTITVFKLAAGN